MLEAWKAGKTDIRARMGGRHGELGLVGDSIDSLLDELDRRGKTAAAAEERRSLLARELSHRVKNTLAVVSMMARQSLRGPDGYDAFSQRLTAFGRAYDLLLADEGQAEEIEGIVKSALSPHQTEDVKRFLMAGPPIALEPDLGVALSLIIHELATNALKYGCMTADTGVVTIVWERRDGRLQFEWRESGGPRVRAPEKEGFGSKLVRRAVPPKYAPEVVINFAAEGLQFTLTLNDGL